VFVLLLTSATIPGRSISMSGIRVGGYMYRQDTPNKFARVCTSLGSRNKMFRTGGTAWGGSGSGSGPILMGPGPSGNISWRALQCFTVGLDAF